MINKIYKEFKNASKSIKKIKLNFEENEINEESFNFIKKYVNNISNDLNIDYSLFLNYYDNSITINYRKNNKRM